MRIYIVYANHIYKHQYLAFFKPLHLYILYVKLLKYNLHMLELLYPYILFCFEFVFNSWSYYLGEYFYSNLISMHLQLFFPIPEIFYFCGHFLINAAFLVEPGEPSLVQRGI